MSRVNQLTELLLTFHGFDSIPPLTKRQLVRAENCVDCCE